MSGEELFSSPGSRFSARRKAEHMKQDLALARLVRQVFEYHNKKIPKYSSQCVSHSGNINERSVLANGSTKTIKVFVLVSAVASCLVLLLKVIGKEHPVVNFKDRKPQGSYVFFTKDYSKITIVF